MKIKSPQKCWGYSTVVVTLHYIMAGGLLNSIHFYFAFLSFLFSVIVDSPLYIRPHSKTVLTLGITNDTQFLSSHLVMDYSLLVGLDSAKKELVIGIIGKLLCFSWKMTYHVQNISGSLLCPRLSS
jgi:hypothetical protein